MIRTDLVTPSTTATATPPRLPTTTTAPSELVFRRAINATSSDFYQHMAMARNPSHKNFIFFSPVLCSLLSLMYAAAPKELQEKMAKSMHMGSLAAGDWHKQLNGWLSTLVKTKELFKLNTGNAILHREGMPTTAPITEVMNQYSPMRHVFKNSQEAKKVTNDWVAEVTEGKITELLEDVPDEAVFLLASAAIFEGNWQTAFDEKETRVSTFVNSDGTSTEVPMMHMDVDCKIAHFENVTILEKPYLGNLSMFFVRPNFYPYRMNMNQAVLDLKTFMNRDTIQNMLDNFDRDMQLEKNHSIVIPRVNIKDKTNLLNELKETPLAKDILDADFKEMFETKPGQKVKAPILTSEVQLTIDEKGTKIAAAAAAVFVLESLPMSFELDCPFGMILVDRSTQTILGMGQILKMQ